MIGISFNFKALFYAWPRYVYCYLACILLIQQLYFIANYQSNIAMNG